MDDSPLKKRLASMSTNTKFLFSRTVGYSLLGIIITLGYVGIISGLGILFSSAVTSNPFVIGLIIFILALLVNPLRTNLIAMTDSLFLRGESLNQEKIQTFSHDLTRAVELPDIINLLQEYTLEAVAPEQMHVFLFDTLSNQYIAAADKEGNITTDLRFTANSGLAQILTQQRAPFIIRQFDRLPTALQAERNRLALLNATIFIDIPKRRGIAGWLALGARQSGENYRRSQLALLESLCDQAGLAIERAQVIANMQSRVEEMNVLSRIAQGVNVTPSFDDSLELIFAQTCQIIPTRDFWVTLHDKITDTFTPVFCVENDERLTDRENNPTANGLGLDKEVIRSQRAILTDDYQQECQKREIKAGLEGVNAWIGVPLNSGADTIGCLSLGNREPGIAYTQEQLTVLQAIADQAASAIVKDRLLHETEKHAHQLASLNEVARQLTSTLDLVPLLNNIMLSAVEILDCEAGSLLLVDEQTDELVFKVTTGPVAKDLINKRMPAHSGLAGKTVKTRRPEIVDNVKDSPDWFAETDKETGFTTRAMLVMPMEVKERVIGVIEVINKRNRQPFLPEDQELLSAFSASAAVAIENARLYTLTDKALNERVEELSVMQRIDRELNASLDITRAMRITLDWAMRLSEANAGLIGEMSGEGVNIMAAEGYGEILAIYEDSPLPLETGGLRAVLESGQPEQFYITGEDQIKSLLSGARSQIVIPIRREEEVMGILLLERIQLEPVSVDTLALLDRLSDHAAIAIANARLYSEVKAANVAKSDFISFVSHELKNPMTSIKGYTELLAAGAVGPINEDQTNFLTTIRSNIERMATLVSDLTDVSRIEAGRLFLEFKAVNIPELIDEVVRSNRRLIDEKEQNLSIQIPEGLPKVWADRNRLIQIITNLVSNASKYTQRDGNIDIKVEIASNQWDSEGAKMVVHTEVKDNGAGISIEDQQKIFQKFFRSEDPKVREAPGTGLGLNITKSLVEMQGGRIWFESMPGEGTSFHFTVPIAE
jgi:signal transduction histidine kinase